MRTAFLILVGYAMCGFAYHPSVYSLTALVYIFLASAPLLIASMLAVPDRSVYVPRMNPWVFRIILLLGFVNLAVLIRSTGHGIEEMRSLGGWLRIASSATLMRYLDGSANGSPLLIAASFFLIAREAMATDGPRAWHTAAAFLPIVLLSIISTAKYPMFVAVCFFLAGILATNSSEAKFRRLPAFALGIGGIGVLASSAALYFRGADPGILFEPIVHYLLAPFDAFGFWLLNSAKYACCSYGIYTFIGPADFLGISERLSGVFDEEYFLYGHVTNIMTSWKYLIVDFSIVGPAVLNTAIGFLLISLKRAGLRQYAVPAELLLILAALMSVVVTPFVHNSVAFAAVACMGNIWFLGRPVHSTSAMPRAGMPSQTAPAG